MYWYCKLSSCYIINSTMSLAHAYVSEYIRSIRIMTTEVMMMLKTIIMTRTILYTENLNSVTKVAHAVLSPWWKLNKLLLYLNFLRLILKLGKKLQIFVELPGRHFIVKTVRDKINFSTLFQTPKSPWQFWTYNRYSRTKIIKCWIANICLKNLPIRARGVVHLVLHFLIY